MIRARFKTTFTVPSLVVRAKPEQVGAAVTALLIALDRRVARLTLSREGFEVVVAVESTEQAAALQRAAEDILNPDESEVVSS